MADSSKRQRVDPIDRYDIGELLGEGAFATVRRATRKSDGTAFAIKLIEKESTSADDAEHERKILSALGLHRHIVSLVDSFDVSDATAFVLELAEGGELFEKLCDGGAYSEADAASVVRQVALALAFMHTAGVCHRDLKPENLLLTADGDVKVADFGLAAFCGAGAPPMTDACGTATYMAPEMILCAHDAAAPPYTSQADLFSVGGLLFVLLAAYNAHDPRGQLSDGEIHTRIVDNEWSFDDYPSSWAHVSAAAKALIVALLEGDPAKRPTADDLLVHPWVAADGAPAAPLPDSHERLGRYNAGRKVWRAAVNAAAVFLKAPLAAAHSAENVFAAAPPAEAAAAAAAPAAEKLPPFVKAELHTAFKLFDLDGSGKIEIHEVKHLVRSLGAAPADASRILQRADKDQDGSIDFDEFTALVRPLYDESSSALRRAFELFDADGSGYIDRPELSLMLRKLGFAWQGAHVFEAADTDSDGKVSFAEFVALFGRAAAEKEAAPAAADAALVMAAAAAASEAGGSADC